MDLVALIAESEDPIGLWRFMTLGTVPPLPAVVAAAAGLPLAASGEIVTSSERFRRQVAERRARDGVWDGRSAPTAAVLAAARRRQQHAPATAWAVRVRRRPLGVTRVQETLRVATGVVTTPEQWQADIDARRAADLERRGWLRN